MVNNIFLEFSNLFNGISNLRYLMKRGYGQPHEKDSGGSDDDDMSDEGTDTDTLPSTSRHCLYNNN